MSTFTVAAATMQTLSMTAAEEASRRGEHTGDIDDMFLALVVNEQVAGQVLRSLGITIDGAREAVAAQHADQLASLGIQADAPGPGRITFPDSGEFSWNERALALLQRANQGKKRGDAAAVLRELVLERSGLIEAIVRRLGATPDQITHLLDDVERYPAPPRHVIDARSLSGVGESYVSAPPEDVWSLLADPARMPEWDRGPARVEDAPDEVAIGSAWTVQVADTEEDGTPMRARPERRRSQVEVVDLVPQRAIEWATTWPDASDANTRRVRIELEPTAGGTHLRVALAWERNPGRRPKPLRRWLMRPLHRFAIWMQISQLGAGIGRLFR